MPHNNTEICSRYEIPEVLTVQVDTREKTPVLFPSTIRIQHPEQAGVFIVLQVNTQRVKLDYGDYRLKKFPICCVIERKASQLELFKNVMDHRDSIRQAKSFRKLSTCEYPYLLVEASPAELMKVSANVRQPDLVIHKLTVAMAKYGLHLLWIPWGRSAARRKTLGEVMLHIMLSCAIHKNLDVLPILV
ncbi:hypothetical protein LCGC14_0476140 [marine sediment metagenome]|uniref:ERCC4 domain-containing protein n=1 Tax=marine sediment metagenome TaxID=412755 RepID=A0A0F9STR3_9ZZZZ